MDKNVFVATASANYLSQGINELQECDRSVRTVKILADKGIAVLESELSREAFIAAVKGKGVIFIRHMHPVDHIEEITGESFQNAVSAVHSYKSRIAPGEKIAVQIRKGSGDHSYDASDIKNEVDGIIEGEFYGVPEVKQPDKIISMLLDNERCYMGLSTPKDNLSRWSGGMVHYRKSGSDISRAMFKLMEAVEVFNIDMSRFKKALDLGAAPGGWTSVLLGYGLKVTAVDTGEMDERLYNSPGLKYIKANVSDLNLDEGYFDLLTSDISWNPKNTAKMINRASAFLKDGGDAVVTLKLMGEKVRRTIREVLEIYREVFEVVSVKQLFHNRDEVTLYLRKK